jgi:hypothetical protein
LPIPTRKYPSCRGARRRWRKVLLDSVADAAAAVPSNFPGPKAKDATSEVMLALYREQLKLRVRPAPATP